MVLWRTGVKRHTGGKILWLGAEPTLKRKKRKKERAKERIKENTDNQEYESVNSISKF